ncbi:aminotransferase class V-fold PLP-dependent enzyme [Herbaspirillum sp. SJZ107]|uniref:aminotransferase class V-fold PLP-dependent enzyme n=1 Tax=Herbaspirillum sp. SJZ107 TaxID=2572881 RepID=UPI001153BACE|nr:aminotransferase class V-fold PLP-dependent enzyme [Herbaspirillum sp. SJZ107]TQK03368.1 selenocysteine lyase/cysteine desulfurase [Herbaspirillum sp. SJZ107]
MIYLDNAATSWPKAPDFHVRAAEVLGAPWGNPHRGAHGAAVRSEELVGRCRARIAALIGAESPDRIAIGYNTTDLLNTAIAGIAERFAPRTAITSILEHNSVLRPLYRLAGRGVELRIAAPSAAGTLDLRRELEYAAARSPDPALVVLAHAVNTTGQVRDMARIGRLCREYGAFLVVDGAQSVGSVPVDVVAMHADAVAFPAHKGLLGPTGLGFLYLGPRLADAGLAPLRVGGGGDAHARDMPQAAPGRFEAGTPNVHGLALLEQSLAWLERQPPSHADAHAHDLWQRLAGVPGIRLYGEHAGAAIVLCNVGDLPSQTVSAVLDRDFGIMTRAGLHCAPLAHEWLGSGASHGGAVRISFGKFNVAADVDAAAAALRRIAESVHEHAAHERVPA